MIGWKWPLACLDVSVAQEKGIEVQDFSSQMGKNLLTIKVLIGITLWTIFYHTNPMEANNEEFL